MSNTSKIIDFCHNVAHAEHLKVRQSYALEIHAITGRSALRWHTCS